MLCVLVERLTANQSLDAQAGLAYCWNKMVMACETVIFSS
ncbi:hypothetical protein WH5701_09214 [Synechococcus sp. WH 5701]|nr:hypothetical protein WH5701_09214 [Synechococcus sp. WH 5701]